MNALLRALALTAALLTSGTALAGEAVPINATFGIQWTQIDWNNLEDRITETMGAAGLPNGKVIGIATRDHLNVPAETISSDYVTLYFSATDWVYAEYEDIPAGFDPATNTASFGGPLKVLGGEGRFVGATGTLTIRSTIPFDPLFKWMSIGTFHIKGVIKTAD